MESSGRTLVCSVLFLDIVEYSRKPVAEQLHLKQDFNRVLARSLEEVPSRDRIILDTGDGAAVTFMGDPEDALFAAMSMRDGGGTVPLRLGVNLGPVRMVKDLNDQMNIIGDGINVAQRVMSFARPGQLLVSRSFYEVVSCLSRDYAKLFHHEGARTDKHVREHDVYSVVGGAPAGRRFSDTASRTLEGDAPGWLARSGPLGVRRSALAIAALVFFGLIGGGVAAHALLQPPPEQSAAAPVEAPSATTAPAAKTAPAPAKGESVPPKKLVARSAEKKAEAAMGRVELAVTPWGEILVDGKSRGVSPPLRVVDLAPGAHTVEIRNSTFPAHVEKVQLKAGEAVRIRHRFK